MLVADERDAVGDRRERPLQARARARRPARRAGADDPTTGMPSAARARSSRCARSASSSCRAREMASSTEAEAPAIAPRSSLA